MKKFISWRRVSTKRQGRSTLGLTAQLDIVKSWAEQEGGEIVADYVDVYTGTNLIGCTELHKAMEHCKRIDATLIIAKTDRFRDDAEAISIYNEMNGRIYFCDCPTQEEFMIKLMFLIAAREARTISLRTKQALNVIKNKCNRGEMHISRQGNAISHLGRDKGCTVHENTITASQRSRRNTAKINPNNESFYRYLKIWEGHNGSIESNRDISGLVCELNSLGFKTARGMDFTESRARAMAKKVKIFYNANYI